MIDESGKAGNAAESCNEGRLNELQERLKILEEEKAELEDKYLRKHADFENYRKRMAKEKAEAIQYANADIVKELLEVLDNFDRAEKAAMEAQDMAAVKNGIEMINSNLTAILKARGLSEIESLGKEFDPEVHQALAMGHDEKVKAPTVVEEYQKGYRLFDRLLRPAQVRVAAPAEKAEEGPDPKAASRQEPAAQTEKNIK